MPRASGVTIDDVQRILRRDFSPAEEPAAARLLAEYARGDAMAGVRTMLAVLKIANGSLEELQRSIDMARTDYRDVLSIAEYPEETRVGWTVPLSDTDRQKIHEADRQQYEEWLHRTEPGPAPG